MDVNDVWYYIDHVLGSRLEFLQTTPVSEDCNTGYRIFDIKPVCFVEVVMTGVTCACSSTYANGSRLSTPLS